MAEGIGGSASTPEVPTRRIKPSWKPHLWNISNVQARKETPRVSHKTSVWRDTFEGYAVKPGCSRSRLVLRSHKTMSHIAI